MVIWFADYLSGAPHCATAERGASPRYSVPLLESCAQHVRPSLMIYAHTNANLVSFATSPRSYTRKGVVDFFFFFLEEHEPQREHKRESLLLFRFTAVSEPVQDYAAPFPGRRGDRLTSPTEHLPHPEGEQAGGERGKPMKLRW